MGRKSAAPGDFDELMNIFIGGSQNRLYGRRPPQ